MKQRRWKYLFMLFLQHKSLSIILSFFLSNYCFEATSTCRVVPDLWVASSNLKGDWKQWCFSLNYTSNPFLASLQAMSPILLLSGGSHCFPIHTSVLSDSFWLFPSLTHFPHECHNSSSNPLCLKASICWHNFFFLKIMWPHCELPPAEDLSTK